MSRGNRGDETVGIGEAAALYRLAPSALRWWERLGLLAPARQAHRRRYHEQDLRRIGLVHLCRNIALMPLNKLVLVVSGAASRAERDEVLLGQLTAIQRQIDRLQAAQHYLRHLLRCAHEDPAFCPVLDNELRQHTPRGRIDVVDLVTAARAAARPVRDEKRDAIGGRDEKRGLVCPVCGRPARHSPRGRHRTYCSRSCQQRAYRARKR